MSRRNLMEWIKQDKKEKREWHKRLLKINEQAGINMAIHNGIKEEHLEAYIKELKEEILKENLDIEESNKKESD